MAEETILDRLPDGRPRPSVSMYNHAVDVANANYRRAEADESQLRSLKDQQETLRRRQLVVVSQAMDALESDASRNVRCKAKAWYDLRDEFYPIEAADPAPSAPPRPAPDYTKETIVQFRIKPPIDEDRWKALFIAAVEAGAVHVDVNPIVDAPPRPEGSQTIAVLLTETDIEGLHQYIEFHGGAHTRSCPADDTCDCKYKPLNDAVNNICQKAFDAQVLAAPPPVVPPTP